jgi:hypothetical protein
MGLAQQTLSYVICLRFPSVIPPSKDGGTHDRLFDAQAVITPMCRAALSSILFSSTHNQSRYPMILVAPGQAAE